MEIKIDRGQFSRSLGKIQGIVEKKNTMPILANCVIKASKNGVEIQATDLDITIKDTCAAEVKKSGTVSLSAKKLYEILRELDEGEVILKEVEPAKVELRSSNFTFDLQGINPEEFPVLPTTEGFKFFEIESEILSEMIRKSIYASAMEEGRFTLNGIFMEKLKDGEMVRFTATDGHRMAMIDREVKGFKEFQQEKGVILPKKGMSELEKLIAGFEGKIQMGVKDNHVAISVGETFIFMRLVDGEFPEYQRVIPEQNPGKVVVAREGFLKSLRRASVLVDEKIRSVKLNFNDGKMVIEGRHPSYGIARGESDCEYSGKPLEIGFNDRYLFDILSATLAGKITMEIKDELSPVLFRFDDDSKYLCVIMPMRI
jgi:DNA polymerase-3 subunit beta